MSFATVHTCFPMSRFSLTWFRHPGISAAWWTSDTDSGIKPWGVRWWEEQMETSFPFLTLGRKYQGTLRTRSHRSTIESNMPRIKDVFHIPWASSTGQLGGPGRKPEGNIEGVGPFYFYLPRSVYLLINASHPFLMESVQFKWYLECSILHFCNQVSWSKHEYIR